MERAKGREGRSGSSDWEALIRQHGRALLLYARQWLRSYAEAEEAVQDGFVRFWKSKHRHTSNPLPLLFTAVRRSAIDCARSRVRREARERKAVELEVDRVAWFEDGLVRDERRREVEAALAGLPQEQREVVTLKIWSELTFREIAEILGIPANTAASRYRYALAALNRELGGSESRHA